MKTRRVLLLALLVPVAFSFSAQAQTAHIRVLASFDAPGSTTFTSARGINAKGEIAGYSLTSGAFLRLRNGTFATFDVGTEGTAGNDVNSAEQVVGAYTSSDGSQHGFVHQGHNISFFDVVGAYSTLVLGINDTGDFVGQYQETSTFFNYKAYSHIGGVVTALQIPEAFNSSAQDINSTGDITGYYTTANNDVTRYGFLLTADGTFTGPFSYPKTNKLGGTLFLGLNSQRIIVGAFYDAQQVQHGLVMMPDGIFLSYDYPGANSTILTGINDKGQVCGDWVDSAQSRHGFLGQLR